MPVAAITPSEAAALTIAAGVCARITAAVALASLPAFPGVSVRVRLALAVGLTAAVLPAALRHGAAVVGGWPLVVVGEAIVGGVIGTAVALVVGAAGWAGSLLGSVSGLAWADDFDPAGDAGTAGIGRLAWWIGVAAFLVAGGQLAVVGGILDSLETIPVGTTVGAAGIAPRLMTLVSTALALALSLALALALPALAAVVAFHLASAICLRAVPFVPGSGVLQGLAALVLLAALGFGLDAWAGGAGTLMHGALERLMTP
jgi:flagellar biosynthetic protein FliR